MFAKTLKGLTFKQTMNPRVTFTTQRTGISYPRNVLGKNVGGAISTSYACISKGPFLKTQLGICPCISMDIKIANVKEFSVTALFCNYFDPCSVQSSIEAFGRKLQPTKGSETKVNVTTIINHFTIKEMNG